MRHRLLALFTPALLLAASGCGGSDGPPALSTYFEARPYANPDCNSVDLRLEGQREMRLYVHGNVDLLSTTQGLARYYHRHSLGFFTQAPPAGTTMAFALDTDTATLTVQLIEAFPNVDLSDEQALMADPVLWNQIVTFIANYVLKPMVQFASEHAAGPGVTNLVVLADLERPGGQQVGDPGTTLAGLAISPALLAEFAVTMPEESDIWQGVTFPPDFTPMMVLGHNAMARLTRTAPDLKDLLTAHEFGHTAALIHTTVERNLMYPSVAVGRDNCTNGLDDAQLATMARTLGLGGAATSALANARAAATSTRATAATPPAFSPADLRAMLAGDRRALRALVERLFHSRAG
jgi:hypothetical protein